MLKNTLNGSGFYYHVTPMENVLSIRERGLIPSIGIRSKKIGESMPSVYLFVDYDSMNNALMNWLGECFCDDCELALLKIKLPDDFPIVDSGVGYEVESHTTIEPEYIVFYDEYENEI